MVVNDDVGGLNERVVRAFFASRLAPTGSAPIHVGTSRLAMAAFQPANLPQPALAKHIRPLRLAHCRSATQTVARFR
ncbi:hypothetical protein F7R06_01690 [Pseudomonas moorei]|nr:hypothetical protein F7R06_01690 [Pseudomonas moorei]